MRLILAMAAAMLAAGCGGGGPAERRLAPGEAAMFVLPEGDDLIFVVSGPKKPDGLYDGFHVAPGTKAQVESDADEPQMSSAGAVREGGSKVDWRRVRVVVSDGSYAGRTGEVQRYKLRPAP